MLAAASVAAATGAAGVIAEHPATGAGATEYELMRDQLGQDVTALREIQSIEAKIARKAEILPRYAEWVDGVVAAAEAEGAVGVQDDVVAQVMVWRIDVGDYEGAMPLIGYVLRWGVRLPERFDRTAGCLVAEEIAEAAIHAHSQDKPFPLDVLLQVHGLTAEEDMPDQVRAKLFRAIGEQMARKAEATEEGADGPAGGKRMALRAALGAFARALELNPKVGVKKQVERLQREENRLQAEADTAAGGQASARAAEDGAGDKSEGGGPGGTTAAEGGTPAAQGSDGDAADANQGQS
jgi:hypothetical protein